jgi:hypothetical protein
MSTAGQHKITATLDGVSIGEFEKRSGGDVSAEPTKSRPGGMAAEKIYPAQRTAGDVVVERTYERDRDDALVKLCEKRTGRGLVTVSDQLLDDDGAPWGTPKTWAGVLNHVEPSDADSNSTDRSTFVLTATVGVPA